MFSMIDSFSLLAMKTSPPSCRLLVTLEVLGDVKCWRIRLPRAAKYGPAEHRATDCPSSKKAKQEQECQRSESACHEAFVDFSRNEASTSIRKENISHICVESLPSKTYLLIDGSVR